MLVARRGDVLWKVLSTIGNAAIAFSNHPSRNSLSVYRALRDFDALQAVSDRQLRTVSKYIVDRKYVVLERSVDGGARISVSICGKNILKRAALLQMRPRPQARWDGLWRLVMFDVPSRQKAARDRFAGLLKTLGFVHYQKSVFICPHPCEDELEVIAEFYGISDCVDIVLATKIAREREYRRHFKIK